MRGEIGYSTGWSSTGWLHQLRYRECCGIAHCNKNGWYTYQARPHMHIIPIN